MAKSATFGVMHIATAFSVTYAITGNITVAGVVTFVEPAVNTVMHYFFDKYWDRRQQRAQRQAAGALAVGMGAQRRDADVAAMSHPHPAMRPGVAGA